MRPPTPTQVSCDTAFQAVGFQTRGPLQKSRHDSCVLNCGDGGPTGGKALERVHILLDTLLSAKHVVRVASGNLRALPHLVRRLKDGSDANGKRVRLAGFAEEPVVAVSDELCHRR